MWSDILTGYGIFILEILTILLVIAAIVAMIISAKLPVSRIRFAKTFHSCPEAFIACSENFSKP